MHNSSLVYRDLVPSVSRTLALPHGPETYERSKELLKCLEKAFKTQASDKFEPSCENFKPFKEI